ncbi:MAG TPA: LysM peptidoglycan-binding domain-containing protein [Chloroflexia bacterium]|nr:LysM peptidoglycan-binding domain-containing protein [Chloroflexia bacterium]
MNLSKLRSLLVITLVAAGLAGVLRPAPAVAAPPAQANLLVNGGLDSFAGNGMANSWEPWWETIQNPGTGTLNYVVRPDFSPESNGAFTLGGSSQHVGRSWDPWHAGIRQTVSVPPGTTVHFTASGKVFASAEHYPHASDPAVASRMQIGAEPSGSIDWASPTVQWSGQANPHDTWVTFSLDVTAGAAGKITLFLSNNYIGDSRLHLDAWWDNASAVVVDTAPTSPPPAATNPPPQPTSAGGQPQPTSPPQSTNPPVSSGNATPTPGADGNIIYIVQEGDTLWAIAARNGVTVEQIRALNGLTSDIIKVGQQLIIGQGTAANPTASAATDTPTTDPSQPTVEIPTATTEPGQPSATAASTQVAVVTEAVGKGTVCALLWNDANGNGVRDPNEGLLAGGQLTVVEIATGRPIQAYTTDGVSEPHCFEDIPAGQYTVSSAAPGGYNATRAPSTPLEVLAGSTSTLEFGAQPSAAVLEEPPAGPTNQALMTSLLFAGGVVFLLLAAGVAGLLFLRRPR